MNAKEKFEIMIEKIENMVNHENRISVRNIAETISNMNGLSYRETSGIFAFLTGYSSLLDYIRERKMMASYKMLISCPILNIEAAIVVSGYDNQSSFSKKFRALFNETPSDAFHRKDNSKILPPLSWEGLSSDASRFFNESIEAEKAETQKFGVSCQQYEKIMQAADLQALRELNDEQSEIAFELSEKFQLPLEATFNFIEDVSCFYFHDDEENFTGSKEALEMFINSNKKLTELYLFVFDGEVSIVDCMDLLKTATSYGIDVFSIPAEYLLIYLREEYRFDQFVKMVALFEKYQGDDFEDFLQKMSLGYSPEEAVKEDDYDDFEIPETQDELEEYLAFEKWADEQTQYSEKIDIDYDEDNPYYSDSDEDSIDAIADEEGEN